MTRWMQFSLVLVTLMVTSISTANAQYIEEVVDDEGSYCDAPAPVVVTRVIRVRSRGGFYPGYRPYGFRGGYRGGFRGAGFGGGFRRGRFVNAVGGRYAGFPRGGFGGYRGGFGGFRGGFRGRRY